MPAARVVDQSALAVVPVRACRGGEHDVADVAAGEVAGCGDAVERGSVEGVSVAEVGEPEGAALIRSGGGKVEDGVQPPGEGR